MRGWRDGKRLIVTMPVGVRGYVIALLPLIANGDVGDDDLAANRLFAEPFTGHEPGSPANLNHRAQHEIDASLTHDLPMRVTAVRQIVLR